MSMHPRGLPCPSKWVAIATLLACIGILAAPEPGFGQDVSIVTLAQREPDPVRFAVLDLESMLRELGLDVEVRTAMRIPKRPASLRYRFLIAVVGQAPEVEEPVQSAIGRADEPAESFAISVVRSQDHADIVVSGRDVAGAMYGVLDVAEQIAMAGTARDMDRSIRDKRVSPATPVRAWRLTLQHQAFEDPFSWYHTEEYWVGLLDQLARARINVLELHGALEIISTRSFSLFPYLYSAPDRPEIGVGQDATRHNMRRLSRIVRQAASRGIYVFLVSNSAGWSIPDNPIDEDTGNEALGAYTRAAVSHTLASCPGLEGIGFRMGESGRTAGFYAEYFIPALEERGDGAPSLVLRSWASDKETVERVTARYSGPRLVEVKTNGDHLALPYFITGGQMSGWSSFGYQDFLNRPRNYETIFEIRTSADHQIFPWADPVFVRRLVKECSLGGALGFSVEAPSSYVPQRDMITNVAHADLGYYTWAWEKDWMWPLLWGRLGYDPELDGDVLVHRMHRHFFQLNRERAGNVLEALGYASVVVPAIAVANCKGPSGGAYAPELEPGPSLDDLISEIQPIDSKVFLSTAEEVEFMVGGIATGKASCREFLSWAQESINRSVTIMGNEMAERIHLEPEDYGSGRASILRSRWQELEALYVDLQALQQLCASVRWRLEGAYHLGLYRRSGHYPSLLTAQQNIEKSHEAWRRLVAVTTRRFHPFHETRRMQSLAFHWAWLNDRLQNDLRVLEAEKERWNQLGLEATWTPSFGHLPARRSLPREPLVIEVSIPPNIPVEDLQIRYRNSSGDGTNLGMGETPTSRIWQTTIPESAVKEGRIDYLIMGLVAGVELQSTQIHDNRPFSVPVGQDTEPPRIEVKSLRFDSQTGLAAIELDVSDASGVQLVRLWHKPLASDAPWIAVPLPGEATKYEGAFPIPAEGAMYCLEAVDVHYLGTMWPNVFVETPYRVVIPE